ncbi:glutaminyl-peptide cyclotransferase [Stratiformator vulcanicus]|uniref:Glutamine cyclotransferase n=1 Tax=Stratiformator vulcanicus TaxID=2527980 RepID=A0A517R1H1_9PLAN|nr:glutaminyl-peptide cyclotransferase [Stratiformator vulcanicus]QDT37755.1 Glutamine cyclotransferase [Stratiformator vulcanicus]
MNEADRRTTTARLAFPAVMFIAVIAVISAVAVLRPRRSEAAAPVEKARIVASFPHDRGAFCQGLLIEGDTLYESTGQYGQSSLREVELKSGKVKRLKTLNQRYFGEGLASHGDLLYQLTWQAGIGFVYDRKTLRYVRPFRYRGEGWGLTSDGKSLILSDGSPTLRFYNPKTFRISRSLTVRDGTRVVDDLNELEFVEGEILANIWHKNGIARINPENGRVIGWIDCSHLVPKDLRSDEEVLNGIAYDDESERLFVTGKNWPVLYEIETPRAK